MRAGTVLRSSLFLLLLVGLSGFGGGAAWAASTGKPAGSIRESPEFRTRVSAGLERLYNMDFAGAESEFAAVEKSFPGHPAGPFLRALLPWWRLQLDPENPALDGAVVGALEQVLARAGQRLRRDRNDPDGLFFEAGALAFRARVATYRGQWLRAGNDGRRALRNLRKLHAKDPGNDDLYFGLGLFDYLVEVVPQRWKFLKPVALLFPRGNRERGLAELRRAAEKGPFSRAEARFALYEIYDRFEKDPTPGAAHLFWLRDRYPDNPLFHVAEGRMYAKRGRWAESAIVLEEVASRQVEGKPGYSGSVAIEALYWLSRGEMAKRSYGSALQYLDRLEFLARERTYDRYFQATGRLRRGMALDALGRRGEAERCYREVLEMAGAGDARDRAREYLGSPYRG